MIDSERRECGAPARMTDGDLYEKSDSLRAICESDYGSPPVHIIFFL